MAKLCEVIDSVESLYLVMEYISKGEVFHHLLDHDDMKEKEA